MPQVPIAAHQCARRLAVLACACAAALVYATAGAAVAATPARANPAATGAALHVPATQVPAAIELTSGWHLRLDPGNVGLAHDWQQTAASPAWKPAAVPGVLDSGLTAKAFAGTIGWYRLTFRAPRATAGFAWAIRFQQVRRAADVWLNGVRLGTHTDPYAPFTLPARSLRPGRQNTLIVRVDNRKGAEPREGWWNWGGITRPVALIPQGPLVTQDPGLMAQLTCTGPDACRARVLFDAEVANRTRATVTPTVVVALTPPAGGPVTRGLLKAPALAGGADEEVRFSFPVAGTPDLWAPGHPALYGAVVDTEVDTQRGDTASQIDTLQIGLRSVTVKGGRLYVNDRPVHLSGASIEEDAPGTGPVLSGAEMDQVVAQLQAIHANVTRAQYPLDQRLMDRLDRAGILLWSQAPIYHRDELLHTAAQRAAALSTLRSSVLQTRDHPSVITHSVANELSPTPDTTPGTRTYLDDAVAEVKALDPTLPVALDVLSYPGFARQQTYAKFQLLGINNYFGWYSGPAAHSTANIAGLAPYLRRMHALYPAQGLMMTEFGAEATMPGPASEKGTYAFQSAYIAQTLSIVRSLPFINGTVYWTLREYAVKPHWYGGGGHQVDRPRNSIHRKGLIAYDGVAKPAFAVIGARYAATPMFLRPVAHGAPSAPLALIIALIVLALVALIVGYDVWLVVSMRRRPAADTAGANGAVVALGRDRRRRRSEPARVEKAV